MTTYATMRTRIADEISRDDLASQISLAVQDAIRQWEGTRFAFNQKRYRILTVASQEYYDLAAPTLLTSAGGAVPTGEEVLELDTITATAAGDTQPYPLCPRTQGWFADWQGIQTASRPTDYGIFGSQLRLYPVPAEVVTLDLQTLARLSTLSADSDTNAWMVEGERLIREQAKVIVYRDVIGDSEGVELAGAALVEAHHALEGKMTLKAHTGRVRSWSL